MTNEFNANVRTLIMSFVFAIMFLIPLRFVEVGNMMNGVTPTVLGESIEVKPVIVLPNAEVEAPLLEAPYANELQPQEQVLGATAETSACYEEAEADKLVEGYTKALEVMNLNEMQVNKTMADIVMVERNRCK